MYIEISLCHIFVTIRNAGRLVRCSAVNTSRGSYCVVENASITFVAWMADRAHCANEQCGTEGFPTM